MKNNYLPLIIIIVLIYMIHTNMGKNIESGDIFTKINITVQDIFKQVKGIKNVHRAALR